MKIFIMGAGLQALGIAYLLHRNEDVELIVVGDSNGEKLADFEANFWKITNKDLRLRLIKADAGKPSSFENELKAVDVLVSSVPYRFNYLLSVMATKVGCYFIDLGGNNDVVEQQFTLDKLAKKAGITIIPDNGLAPGLVSILTADAVNDFEEVHSVKIRVGGLPQRPGGLLDYTLTFSVNGLVNEYVEPAFILENGAIKKIASLDNFEIVIGFPTPFLGLEAFTTSGGISTLPFTYKNQIKNLDYKTIRYPGHGHFFQKLKYLGLLSSEQIKIKEVSISPRSVFENVAGKALDTGEPDVILMRVAATGLKGGKETVRTYQMVDYSQDGLSAMMCCTGFPAAVVALMLGRNQIQQKGVKPLELVVDTKLFLNEIQKHLNIPIEEEEV